MNNDQMDSIQLLNDRYSAVERALYSATSRLLVNELLTAKELLDGAIAHVKHEASRPTSGRPDRSRAIHLI